MRGVVEGEGDGVEEVFGSKCGGQYVRKELVNGPEIVQYKTPDGTVYHRGGK